MRLNLSLGCKACLELLDSCNINFESLSKDGVINASRKHTWRN
ncbi:hypothetical protein Patl1_05862 [Pistacia atlantica]|uniref:Uncharacterized protein n=1 Tax=Pistacia atlantica TaxID=434234 RepID=A0ACC1BRY0_9ROSI|nr:hypothetical protein Patl1_05862 [Pistacia atlantica]